MDLKALVGFCVLGDPPQRGAFAPESSNWHHATVRAVHEHIPTKFHRTPGADDAYTIWPLFWRGRTVFRQSGASPVQALRHATPLGEQSIGVKLSTASGESKA
ncbi:hypothetical protein [Mycolicibacterium sp. HK-90]|uniref:hypothetical protein n=1 Tax=Mycolicibacterium sp. HK-90 TaxID=3056937 RepID=UPI002658722D|nr:hypothetical protein [Mycolicibacterium sp. HK-90]WKG04588.1 hypothetical protein QU592_05635 [Mycolicibacterium sp. HK-90]